jgi:hypothetical protein
MGFSTAIVQGVNMRARSVRLPLIGSLFLASVGTIAAAPPRSPFELGDLSSLAEPSAAIAAGPVDSTADIRAGALYGLTVSSDALGAASLGSLAASESYASAKVGPLWFFNDLDNLDTGFSLSAAFGHRIFDFLAIEVEGGYFRAEESNGSTDLEVWGIPVLFNARVSLSLLLFELYGGLGVGGFFVHSDVDSSGSHRNQDDVVFGGDAFAGLGINLGPLLVAVEAKYYATSTIDFPGTDERMEALALFLAATMSF